MYPRVNGRSGSGDEFVHDNLVDRGEKRVALRGRFDLVCLGLNQPHKLAAHAGQTVDFSETNDLVTYLENNIVSSDASVSAVMHENSAEYRLATCRTAPSLTDLPTNPARPRPSASSASFLRLSTC